jgi:hypothetical protein
VVMKDPVSIIAHISRKLFPPHSEKNIGPRGWGFSTEIFWHVSSWIAITVGDSHLDVGVSTVVGG